MGHLLLLGLLLGGFLYWRRMPMRQPDERARLATAREDLAPPPLPMSQSTDGTPATQPTAPQHLSADDEALDARDAANADSFPTTDPPSSSDPSTPS